MLPQLRLSIAAAAVHITNADLKKISAIFKWWLTVLVLAMWRNFSTTADAKNQS
jgi:hypothetical protein